MAKKWGHYAIDAAANSASSTTKTQAAATLEAPLKPGWSNASQRKTLQGKYTARDASNSKKADTRGNSSSNTLGL